MKIARHIKEFYTKKPKYAKNYTDLNCGHFATYWALEKVRQMLFTCMGSTLYLI